MTEQVYPYDGPFLQPLDKPAFTGSYDVGIWRFWSSYGSFPIVEVVQAESPFAAIEQVMRAHGLKSAGHASAIPCGKCNLRSYYAYGIKLGERVVASRLHRQQSVLQWSSSPESEVLL